MTNKIIIAVTVGVAITLFGVAIGRSMAPAPVPQVQTLGDAAGGASGGNVRYTKAPTNTNAVLTANTSSQILATSTSRNYVAIVNDSTSTTIYLGLGVPAQGSNGIRLNAAGGSYELDANDMFTGAIYAIASSTGASVTIVSSQ